MASKDFFLQGFTTRTYTDAVLSLFKVPNLQHVLISVAFINQDGVKMIERELTHLSRKVTVFSGVRNDITSHQGLAGLLKVGVKLFIVDTGTRNVVFHPKIYFARGSSEARLVIGSGNLTLGGLNNNIEAGLVLSLDAHNQEDKLLISRIEDQFKALPSLYPQNIFQIKKVSDLDKLLSHGRLLDEAEVQPPRPTTTAKARVVDIIPSIRLKVIPLHRTLRRASSKPAVSRVTKLKVNRRGSSFSQISTSLELVWESKDLTKRDLNIPDEKNTHRTGSINLDKGLLDESIDHRHYFRDSVFAHLYWEPRHGTQVEEAGARFQLVIKGIYYGEFTLLIRHSVSTTSRSYRQHNAMTRLSWGPMSEYIANADLIGRTLSIYRDEAEQSRFVLEID